MIDSKIMATTKSILKEFGKTYFTEEGALKRNRVIEDLDAYTPMLMKSLLANKLIHDTYTKRITVDNQSIEIFKLNQFAEMFTYKDYWEDSYTKFENKIGLTANNKFIDESADVVLDFPFKDTVLKAGMTKEDQKDTDEPFLHETIAKAEIDQLLEPKIFVNATQYNTDNINGHPVDKFENDSLIIKGNNLIALHSLKERYSGCIKLIYLDPPYNTGSDSFSYNDNFNHAAWLTFMSNRLEIAKDLLTDDGMIFIHTDDTEYAYLKVLMDQIFGRNKYLNTVSVKTKSSSGASGGGEDKKLKKNTEFITIYRNDFAQINIQEKVVGLDNYIQDRKKEGKSFAYKSVLVNRGTMSSIGETVDGRGNKIELFDVQNYEIKSISQLSKEEHLSESEIYVKYIDSIFTTENAQTSIRDRVKAVVNDNGYTIARYTPVSGRNKGKSTDVGFIGSTKRLVSFISATAYVSDGVAYKTEKAGTLWDDISWASVNREGGGVSFDNGEKPEKLLKRIISSGTNSGDIVLDFFMGSATTQAAAMKMNRRFIGIEQMDYIKTVSIERLKKVIAGEQGGISKDVNWQGGGSFVYAELMEKNQGYLKDVQHAETTKELENVVQRMVEGGADFDFRVDLDKVLQEPEYQTMSLDDRKRLVLKVIDKNQLYYSYGDLGDSDVQELMSASDIAFNKSFYGE